jgi:hypothetical protein
VSKRYLPILLLLFLAVGGIQLPLPVGAQNSGWSAPIELGAGWFPDLATGPDGSVHVIWHAGRSWPIELRDDLAGAGRGSAAPADTAPADAGEDERPLQDRRDTLIYRDFRNGGWSPENEIFTAGFGVSGLTVRNSIVMGRDGRMHILFRNGFEIDYFHAPWEQAWSAAAWSPSYTMSTGSAYYNAMAVDSRGRLHALYTRTIVDEPTAPRQVCPDCAQLFYRHSGDVEKVWSWPINLSRDFEGANRPQIKIDQRDRVHVVWDEGFDWYAGEGEPLFGVYRRSDDGGQTWNAPVPIGVAEEGVLQTTLALTAEGNPFLVYRGADSRQLYYQVATDDANWSVPGTIPGVVARDYEFDNQLDVYSMVTDSAGVIHLLMGGYLEGDQDGTLGLFHLTWNGTTWSAPEVVFSNERKPEWPRLALTNGNQLHAVWFSRVSIFSAGDTLVHYSNRTLNTAAVTAPAFFTPTPERALIATATAQPIAPTPMPTIAPELLSAPVPEGEPEWEGPGLTTIGIALTPIISMLMIYGGFTWHKRRRKEERLRR